MEHDHIAKTQKEMILEIYEDMKEIKEKVITNSISLKWNWKITLIILTTILGLIGGMIAVFANMI